MGATQDIAGHVRHLRVDPQSDEVLDALVGAIGDVFERAYLVGFGDGETLAPWSAITDPRTAPAWALPHVAVWVGGELPARALGESEAAYLERARYALIYPRGMRRGSIGVLREAVRATLTGNREVIITERPSGDTHRVLVQTYASETPDPTATEVAARQVPIDASIVLEVGVLSGLSWDGLGDESWDDQSGKAWDDMSDD